MTGCLPPRLTTNSDFGRAYGRSCTSFPRPCAWSIIERRISRQSYRAGGLARASCRLTTAITSSSKNDGKVANLVARDVTPGGKVRGSSSTPSGPDPSS